MKRGIFRLIASRLIAPLFTRSPKYILGSSFFALNPIGELTNYAYYTKRTLRFP